MLEIRARRRREKKKKKIDIAAKNYQYRDDEKIDIAAIKKIDIAATKKLISRRGNRAGLLKNRGGLATISKVGDG